MADCELGDTARVKSGDRDADRVSSVAVGLVEKPEAVARALIVSVDATVIGVEYFRVEPPTAVPGAVPSSV